MCLFPDGSGYVRTSVFCAPVGALWTSFNIHFILCVHALVHMWMEMVREQLPDVGFLLPPCAFLRSNSGGQVWWQALLYVDVCHWPEYVFFFIFKKI